MSSSKSKLNNTKKDEIEKFLNEYTLPDDLVRDYVYSFDISLEVINKLLIFIGIVMFIGGTSFAFIEPTRGVDTSSIIEYIVFSGIILYIIISTVSHLIFAKKAEDTGLNSEQLYYHFITKSIQQYRKGNYDLCLDYLEKLQKPWLECPLHVSQESRLNLYINRIRLISDRKEFENEIERTFEPVIYTITSRVISVKNSSTIGSAVGHLQIERGRPLSESRFKFALKTVLSGVVNWRRKGLLIYGLILLAGPIALQIMDGRIVSIVVMPTLIAIAHYINTTRT